MAQTIQSELNDLVAKFAKNSISQPNADDPFTPVLDANGAPVEPTATATAPNVTPAAAPPAAPTPAPEPVKPVESGLIEDWDKDTVVKPDTTPAPEPVVAAKPEDFSEIAKVLGKEDVKEKAQVLAEVAELKQKAELLKSSPEDLVKAMEIAKAGGNYLEYLQVSVVDWAKEDPLVLYENYVEDQFYNPETGLVDYEKVDKVLEKMDDEEKEFRGKELQRQYVAYQKQQKELLTQQAQAKRVQFETSVKQIVDEIKDVNGYVITPAKKQELLEYVLTGQDLQENDLRSRVVNAFIKKNFPAIDKYNKTAVRNATQRDILAEATIPDVKPSITPAAAPSTKQYNLQDFIQELAKKNGL